MGLSPGLLTLTPFIPLPSIPSSWLFTFQNKGLKKSFNEYLPMNTFYSWKLKSISCSAFYMYCNNSVFWFYWSPYGYLYCIPYWYVFPLSDSADSCSHVLGLLCQMRWGIGRAAVPGPEVVRVLSKASNQAVLNLLQTGIGPNTVLALGWVQSRTHRYPSSISGHLKQ